MIKYYAWEEYYVWKITWQLQKKYNVSIAMGYSYSADVRSIGYEKLVSEADKWMYENKEILKNEGASR